MHYIIDKVRYAIVINNRFFILKLYKSTLYLSGTFIGFQYRDKVIDIDRMSYTNVVFYERNTETGEWSLQD